MNADEAELSTVVHNLPERLQVKERAKEGERTKECTNNQGGVD